MNFKFKDIFNGKEKAWASSVAMFLVTILMVKTNGDPLDPAAVENVTNTAVEFSTALASSAIAWFVTWVTGNTPTVENNVTENPE